MFFREEDQRMIFLHNISYYFVFVNYCVQYNEFRALICFNHNIVHFINYIKNFTISLLKSPLTSLYMKYQSVCV